LGNRQNPVLIALDTRRIDRMTESHVIALDNQSSGALKEATQNHYQKTMRSFIFKNQKYGSITFLRV